MADIVESFIADIRSIESLTQSNRRFEIRKRITELEGMPKANGASQEEIRSVLQDARDRAFQEISPTRLATSQLKPQNSMGTSSKN